MPTPTTIQLLDFSIAAVFIALLGLCRLGWPPASYLIAFYCRVFDTDQYSPLLIASVATLVYVVPVYFIKKRILRREEG